MRQDEAKRKDLQEVIVGLSRVHYYRRRTVWFIGNADAWTVYSAAELGGRAAAEDHRLHDHHGGEGPAALLPPPERPGAAGRVPKTAERGAGIISIFWSSGFATFIQCLAFIWGPASALTQAAGLVVSASNDSTLRVWRLTDGACLRTLIGHTDLVCAVVDVGGGRVASGGVDRVLRVWDVLSGKQLQQTPTGEGFIWCAAALWGDHIATGHIDGEIRLWSLGNGGCAAGVLRGHTNDVCSLAVVGGSTAQRLLASGSDDNTARLWDVDAGTCTAVLNGHTRYVCCLADLGGGRLLSGSYDRSLRVWNTVAGACLAVVPDAHGDGRASIILAARALPGGAATGSYGGDVQRWKWDEGANALTPDGAALQLGGDVVRSITAAPGSGRALQLLAGCGDGILRVLGNGASGALQQQAALTGHSEIIRAVAVMMAE